MMRRRESSTPQSQLQAQPQSPSNAQQQTRRSSLARLTPRSLSLSLNSPPSTSTSNPLRSFSSSSSDSSHPKFVTVAVLAPTHSTLPLPTSVGGGVFYSSPTARIGVLGFNRDNEEIQRRRASAATSPSSPSQQQQQQQQEGQQNGSKSGSGFGFFRRKSSTTTETQRRRQGQRQRQQTERPPFVTKTVPYDVWRAHYAKDAEGNYKGTGTPAEDCLLLPGDVERWRFKGDGLLDENEGGEGEGAEQKTWAERVTRGKEALPVYGEVVDGVGRVPEYYREQDGERERSAHEEDDYDRPPEGNPEEVSNL